MLVCSQLGNNCFMYTHFTCLKPPIPMTANDFGSILSQNA